MDGEVLDSNRLPLLPQDSTDDGGRRNSVFPFAPALEPALAIPQPDRGLLESRRSGDARGQVVGDLPEIELTRDRLAHLEQCGLIVELVAEEQLVERRLEAPGGELEQRRA